MGRTGCAGFSWENAFDLIQAHVPHELITPEQFDHARQFARGLPALWHWGMLETRLQHGDHEVDLLGAIARSAVTDVRLASVLSEDAHPGLSPVACHLRQWLREKQNPVGKTPTFWLEWDRDGRNSSPLSWLCLAADFFDPACPRADPGEVARIVGSFLKENPAMSLPGAPEVVFRLAELLPPGGRLMSFASLRPRGRNVCRVFVQLPRGKTEAWLRRIGWDGDWDFVRTTRNLFEVDGEAEWCQIEFGERICPYVGFELSQTERGPQKLDARQVFLDELVRRGWAAEERARAVLRWQGRNPVRLASGRPAFLQRTFHLKLASSGEGAPQAKAYLGFCCHRAMMTAKSAPPRFRRALLRAS